MRIRFASLMLAWASGVSAASAQGVPSPEAGATIPPVVVTATRVPTPVEDIPAGVTVITREEIQLRGYNTLPEALAAVPGIRVAQSGGPGGNASIFVRGTNSNQVLVLRDGMPINDGSDPGSAFNFGVDTLADVQRIEIVRGPMASLYGSGAIGGVINLITLQGSQPGVHASADIAGGYPAQLLNNEVVSGIDGALDYAAIVQTESLTGFDSTPQRESIYTGTPQGYREQVGTVNLGYTALPGTRFSLLLRGHRAVFGFNQLGNPTFDDANSTGHDTSLLGRIGVRSLLAGGVYETSLFLGGLQNDRRYFEPFNPADTANMASNDLRYHAYRSDAQWNNTVHLSDLFRSSIFSATDLTFGYERTGDTAKVRINSSSQGLRLPTERQRVDGRQRGLCGTAIDALGPTHGHRAGATGLGIERPTPDLAAWHRAGCFGNPHPVQGRLRHRFPRSIAVRPLRRRLRPAMSAIRICCRKPRKAGKSDS